MRKIILDFDDYHWLHPENCLAEIKNLVKHLPDVKILLFTIPMLRGKEIGGDKEFCEETRNLIEKGNIQLAIHGTFHTQEEFKDKSKQQALASIELSEACMKEAGLPFVNIFKGPHWALSKGTLEALIEKKYKTAFIHESQAYLELYKMPIDLVYYNWNLKDNPPSVDTILYAHGHTHDVCSNGIAQVSNKIIELTRNETVTFHFPEENLE